MYNAVETNIEEKIYAKEIARKEIVITSI